MAIYPPERRTVAAATASDAAMTDLFANVQPTSEYNRELNRLVAQLRAVADRLEAFADTEPELPLIAGLVERGHRHADAVAAVLDFTRSSEGSDIPRDAASALAWVIRSGADELDGVTVPVPFKRRR